MALYGGQVQTAGYQAPNYNQVIQANALANAQQQQILGDIAGQAKDYFKQQGERKKLIKQSSLQIDAALQLFPDLAPSFQGLKERMKDENIPLADRAAEAEVVANLINTGIGEMRNRADMSFKQQQFEAEQQYRQAGLGMQAAELGVRQQARQQEAQTEAAKRTEGEISIFDPTIGKERKAKVWKDQFGNAFDWDTKKPIIDTEKYFYGEEGGLGDLPPTSQVGGISDSIAKVAQMNIGRLSTAKTPGTQGGGLGCADAVCKIYNQATGEELVQGGTLSTSKMIESLSGDPRFQSIPVNQAQAGDIIITPRGKKAGHTGIFVNDNEIASNSSKGFRGGQRGTLEQNYSKGSWMSSVATRNPGTTQVFRRIEEAASPQMAGTSEQQAEIARQIEQGAGMATAQTGGGMPTEPSIAQQQPQLPERRMVRGIPVGGDAKPQGTIMNPASVQKLIAEGFAVSAIPTKDGNFFVTSAKGGGEAGMETIVETLPGGGTKLTQRPRVKGATEEATQEKKANVSETLLSLASAVKELDDMNAIVNPDKPSTLNIPARLASTAAGQIAAGAVGTKAQDIRDRINMIKPSLISSIREATGMSAKAMDSNTELQFYLQQVGDETKSIYANLAAIDALDRQYGTKNSGKGIIDQMFSDNPELISKIRGQSKFSTKPFGGAVKPINPEAQSILDEYK